MTDTTFQETVSACQRVLAVVALFSLFINLLLLTAPLYMLQMFDRVLTSGSEETLIFLTVIAVLAFLALGALEAVRNQVMVRMGGWLDRRLGGPLLAGSVTDALSRRGAPSVQGLRDLGTFRGFLTGPAIFPLFDAPWTPVFLVVIFLLHPLLGWLATGAAALLFLLAVINELATRGPLGRSGQAMIGATAEAEAAVRNADVIQAMGMLPALIVRWNRRNGEMLAAQEQASLRGGRIMAISKFLRLGLQIGVLGTGAWLVLQHELTAGAMIAGSILVARALAPVDQAIGSWRTAVMARQAWQRVKARLARAGTRPPAMPLPEPKGALRVDGMGFAWPGTKLPLLRNVNFALEPGEVLGVIGPTAAGKTTLARLLVGNLEPMIGHVRLDDADVAGWAATDQGRNVGYLPQDVELFGGTVRENIARMGEAEARQVVTAAQLAGVHELILSLPDGYDTEIGASGAVLSGGQRQRIALARAMFGNPRLVVLDEPNAGLDQPGEHALVEAISALKHAGATVVIIAHRPNVLRMTDRILVLRDGTVEMFGARDEVLARFTGPRQRDARIAPASAIPGEEARDVDGQG